MLWDAELDGSVLGDEGWAAAAKFGTDDPSVFSAYLRALRWNTATAAGRNLFQTPFRAGIHQDAYQLLPLRKALRLPRVNLLIADDVGAGKTVEAGLVLRELLLRRRIDLVLVAAPAGMVRQWQDFLPGDRAGRVDLDQPDQLAMPGAPMRRAGCNSDGACAELTQDGMPMKRHQARIAPCCILSF